MNGHDRLRGVIERERSRLRAGVPAAKEGAILALLRARDGLPHAPGTESPPDLVTGRRLDDPGGNTALRFCLESVGDAAAAAGDGLDGWGERFLEACGRLVAAESVLARCEAGFMRTADDGDTTFDAWIATTRAPTGWRERADVDWWAAWLARRHEPERRALEAERSSAAGGDPRDGGYSRRLADVSLKAMAYQLGYPADADIGGCPVRTYRDVLGRLIGWALAARDREEAAAPRSERDLVAVLAADLGVDPVVVGRAVAGFTLGPEGAAYHAAVPGVAAAPLVRLDPDRLVWSVRGLTTEPLFFLTRELRRRVPEAYHNSAHLREGVFRRELAALFGEKRFVSAADRVKLRRGDGDVRTDVDAVVFDRKSGALGVFELKSQDPFARSTAELTRQRDNVLDANRQIGGVLDWLNRHGADALLDRVDARTAKTFRVRKVYPFVLGRYLAHFGDGPEPDRRAAWGTWPQLLRLLDGEPVRGTDANPLASLFARLRKEAPLTRRPADGPPCEIVIGAARLVVHPSYAAYRASAAGGGSVGSRQGRSGDG